MEQQYNKYGKHPPFLGLISYANWADISENRLQK